MLCCRSCVGLGGVAVLPPLGYLPLAVLNACFTLACLECCVGLGGVAVQPLLSDLPLAVLSACFALACVDCCCSGCLACGTAVAVAVWPGWSSCFDCMQWLLYLCCSAWLFWLCRSVDVMDIVVLRSESSRKRNASGEFYKHSLFSGMCSIGPFHITKNLSILLQI